MAKIRLDLSEVNKWHRTTPPAQRCSKKGCTNPPPYYRHHKGHDRYIGYYYPAIAKRYYEWRDCVDICDQCHMCVHYLYTRIALSLISRGELQRQRYISIADEFLASDTKPEVTKEFKTKWQKSRKAWKRKVRRRIRKAKKAAEKSRRTKEK